MSTKLKWGILGTGGIAKALAKAIGESTTGELVAVGSRSQASADKFGDEFKVPATGRHPTYQALLDDKSVQVVYISLPNDQHAEWTIKCARAGKHILCEKPFASNHPEAMAVIEAVRECPGIFLLEAFMYRAHPQTAKIVELVKSGVIGQVKHIQANFSFDFGEAPDNIRSKASMAGGGIMDVGCYTLSFCRIVAGAAAGLDGPAEPTEVKGLGHLMPNPDGAVDSWATATLKFPGDILCNVVCGLQLNCWAPPQIFGSKGRIVVHNPWFPGHTDENAKIEVHVGGEKEPRIIHAPSAIPLYAHEVDVCGKAIAAGQREAASPAMTWKDTLGNAKTIDRWRKEFGLVFPMDTEEGLKNTTYTRRPLEALKPSKMPHGKIDGLDKPVSRLVLGTMGHVIGWQDISKAAAMFDRFVELGGNTLDTALVYGSEASTGKWLRLRNIRERMVIIGKAAASNDATPEMVDRELPVTLERMGVDYFDVFMMHRDNPKVPVGEFVEVFNKHKKAGRIRTFGGSNWSTERVQAFNDYAKQKGLTPMASSSPNFSLARWNEPMWAGCCHAVDPADRAWYAKSGVGLFAWSSQANGFFANRWTKAGAAQADKEIQRVWFNDGNWQRLDRVNELAKKKNVPPFYISLAYVLCQPMNIYALIGPETLDELRQSHEALDVKLTAQEMAWLNLEA